MSVVLMRHGQDELGYRGGWSKFGLTKEGRQQVYEAAQRLSEIPFDVIISSDLPRAFESARVVVDVCQKELIIDRKFREINNGDLAGMKNEIADVHYPGLYYNRLDFEECYTNGESHSLFYDRILATYQKIIK